MTSPDAEKALLADLLAEREHIEKWERVLLTDEARVLFDALERAVYIAEHLFQMVPRQVWLDSGGDDGQGHYEGEYHAEQLREKLAALSAVGPAGEEAT